MITLTKPDGQKVQIDEKLVLRIRVAMLSADQQLPHIPGTLGHTRVDAGRMFLVDEEPSSVAALVLPGLATLVQFTMPDGNPIWINAKKASGPVFVVPPYRTDGIRSALMLGNERQLLADTPERIYDLILSAGGEAIPIQPDSMFSTGVYMIRSLFNPIKNWDEPIDRK